MSTTNLETGNITINGVEYVRKDSAQNGPQTWGGKRIIVASSGWIFVGDCEDHTDGSVTIHNASNIRVWGTKAGLGELVYGPLSTTKHDPYGLVRCTPLVQISVVSGW